MSTAKITLRLEESGTTIRRDIAADPKVYKDTIAGYQRGNRWIVNYGSVSIVADSDDLASLARLILAKLT